MSKGRYIFSIVLAVAVFLGLYFLIGQGYFEWEILLFSYACGSFAGDLFFWEESISARVLLFIWSFIPKILIFWWSLLTSSVIGFIISLFIMAFCFGAIGVLFSFGLGIAGIISTVTFIIQLVTLSRDLY
ncbi:MAG: hypothetical protein IJW26_03360 [Clostridia bacterium]|nr:hypothetical protein [Clostridia bacterium]